MATYYVSTTGSDGRTAVEAQNISTPWLTVANGCAHLSAGDILDIRAGTYIESVVDTIGSGVSWGNPVTLRAHTGETVWMKPPAATEVIFNLGFATSQAYIEFDGINLDGTNIRYFLVKLNVTSSGEAHHIRFKNSEWLMKTAYVGVLNSGDRTSPSGTNEFTNLVIHGNTANSFDSHLASLPNEAFYLGTSNNLIDGCEIYDIIGGGGQLDNSYSQTQDGNIIRNNYWHDIITSNAGDPFSRIWGFVVYGTPRTNTQFYNNIIANCGTGGSSHYGFVTSGGANNTQVWNNTIYNINGIGADMNQDGTNIGGVFKNNVVYNCTTNTANLGGTTQSNNSISGVNPQFTSVGTGNFLPAAGSPLIDAGTTISQVTVDKIGTHRPQGSSYDIGAYEVVSGGGGTTAAFVNRSTGGNTASSSTLVTSAQSVTTGNLLVLWIYAGTTGRTISSVTDTAGNSWTNPGLSVSISDGTTLFLYYAYNCLGNAANQVTITYSGATIYRAADVQQFSGIKTSADPLIDRDSGTGTGTTLSTPSLSIGSLTAVVSGWCLGTAMGLVAGSGFDNLTAFAITGDANQYFADEYKLNTTGNQVPSATATNGEWSMLSAAFEVATAASGTLFTNLERLTKGLERGISQ